MKNKSILDKTKNPSSHGLNFRTGATSVSFKLKEARRLAINLGQKKRYQERQQNKKAGKTSLKDLF
jgi:aspartate aminotransferase-like enzyme